MSCIYLSFFYQVRMNAYLKWGWGRKKKSLNVLKNYLGPFCESCADMNPWHSVEITRKDMLSTDNSKLTGIETTVWLMSIMYTLQTQVWRPRSGEHSYSRKHFNMLILSMNLSHYGISENEAKGVCNSHGTDTSYKLYPEGSLSEHHQNTDH